MTVRLLSLMCLIRRRVRLIGLVWRLCVLSSRLSIIGILLSVLCGLVVRLSSSRLRLWSMCALIVSRLVLRLWYRLTLGFGRWNRRLSWW